MNQASDVSPYAVAPIVLPLLSSPKNGPSGKFFRRDGRYMAFAAVESYDWPLNT